MKKLMNIYVDKLSLWRILFVLIAIGINSVCSNLAIYADAYLYLDTIGTILITYCAGIFPGIIAAMFSSILGGIFDGGSLYFAILNILVAIVVYIFTYKGWMKKFINVILLVLILSLIGGLIGTLIEFLLNGYESTVSSYESINFISKNTGITEIPSLFIIKYILELLDKGISFAIALLIAHFIPKRIKKAMWDRALGKETEFDIKYEESDINEVRSIHSKTVAMLIGGVVLLTIVMGIISVTIYLRSAREEHIEVANGAVAMTSDLIDPEKIDEYIEKGHSLEEYKQIENSMYIIRKNTPNIEYLYVYKIEDDGCRVVFDLNTNDVRASEPGDMQPFDKSFSEYIPKLKRGEEIDPIETNDTYGWLITVYQPIFDEEGNCVCYVGCDVSMKDITIYVSNFILRVIMVFSSFFALILAFGIFTTVGTHRVIEKQYSLLLNAREKADRANITKSRFLANMSHEIRTPINTIMGMNEMILREDINTSHKEYTDAILGYANDIKVSSDLLLSIINDILDLSKIESGKMELIEDEYNTKDMLRSVISMVEVRSKESKLTFDKEIDENLPKKLYGDAGKIKQVVLNLLTNAVKYTEKGGFKLVITVIEKDDERVRIKISVKDTGIGIKPEDKDKLFSAFKRLEEKKNNAIQGTGLGLDISKKFVELMGGELECESVYGEGSEFFFELEQKIIDGSPIGKYKDEQVKHDYKKYIPQFVAPEGKVLVVDDNKMNLMVIKGLLKATQINVTTVTGGRECLDMLAKEHFDIVLLDHMMPEMDGLETIAKIREDDEAIPVIALTANAATDGGTFYKGYGFTDYLAKPVNGPVLERMMKEYLPAKIAKDPNMVGFEEDADEKLPKEYLWLNEVEGISVYNGLKYCGSEDAFIRSITSFYESLKDNADLIEKAYKENDIKTYTIKVHSLKSSARIIGAADLSKLAKELEDAGNDENMSFIDDNTNTLLKMYREYADKLKNLEVESEDESKEMISEDELAGAYDAIKELVDQMDYDGMEMLLEEVGGYRLPKKDQEFFKEIEKNLKKLDWEKLEELLQS